MPCHHLCPIRQLNTQLTTIKEDKIATLRQILKVTEELGREAPHRRDEVERSISEIERKLVGAVAEKVHLTDEIARGCNPCQIY